MIKALKVIEEKAIKTAKDAVEEQVNKSVEEMKEAGLDMMLQVTESEIEKLKETLTKRLTGEILGEFQKEFAKEGTTMRFKGEPGEDGKSIKGDPGEDGETPIKGVHYDDGEKGDPGEDGKSIKGDKGDDGSPDTTKQIAKKLNADKEIVNMNVIKGLDEAFKRIRSLVRKKGGGTGGGGMGKPLPFSFDGDNSTTEFNLPGIPSGPHLAIWVYYQGQWLQPTTHYTVSGTTLTLTFTPEDDTKVEGFLIP